ncbi:MAG: MATE family efflux transporter, partial [Desulfovibrio sp.]|nr:MATE family efflux transporter [Desulfovibrio sp.]
VCSQYLGAGRLNDYAETGQICLYLNRVLGLVVSGLLYIFAEKIIDLLEVSSELRPLALVYLEIVGGFAWLYALAVTFGSILRAREMAVYPMYVALISNLINLLGNYALIFGHFGCPALGVQGAALATVLSRAISFALLWLCLLRHGAISHAFKLAQTGLAKLKQILQIGLPGAGEMFSYTSSQVLITYFINLLGTEALAARTYLMNVVILTFVFAIAMSQGASILTGHLTGQHKYLAAQTLGAMATKISIYLALIISLILAITAPIFVPYLTPNPKIQELCLSIFWIDVLLEVGRVVNILTGRLLASVGDPLYPLRVSICFVWTVATFGSYLFGLVLGFGLIGMWVVFLIDENLRAYLQWRHWQKGGWMHKSLC